MLKSQSLILEFQEETIENTETSSKYQMSNVMKQTSNVKKHRNPLKRQTLWSAYLYAEMHTDVPFPSDGRYGINGEVKMLRGMEGFHKVWTDHFFDEDPYT